MSDTFPAVRSLLFVPGGRADMIAKAPRSGPDAVVVDLEDAVARDDKDTARATAVQAVAALPAGLTLLIRVNPPGSPWFADDVAAAVEAGVAGVVLPKLERAEQLRQLRDRLPTGAAVIAGLETALGVADCRELLAGPVEAAYFGAEDYIADLGGRRTPEGQEVSYARSRVCLAARLCGVAALDQVVAAVHDDERFLAEAQQARAMGYAGKLCLHPRQVELAHRAFTPSAEEIEHARAVVAAARDGVGVVDGQMIDDVHLRMAGTVLRRAGQQP